MNILDTEFFLVFKKKYLYLAYFLARLDFKLRYRRSLLGPVWVTLTTGLLIFCISLIFGRYVKIDYELMVPHIALGIIFWNFISSNLTDSCNSLINSQNLINQVRIPYLVYIVKTLIGNIIIFLYNFLIILLVIFIYYKKLDFSFPFFFLGFTILCLNLFWMMTIISFMNLRFRDIKALVQNLIQILFYMTPIIWVKGLITFDPLVEIFLSLNLFSYLIDITRVPLMNEAFFISTLSIPLITLIIGISFTIYFVEKNKKRVHFWF